MLEAAKAAKRESPRTASDSVSVYVDARAEVTAAKVLVPEETHGNGWFGGE